jgi:hypothetical protein
MSNNKRLFWVVIGLVVVIIVLIVVIVVLARNGASEEAPTATPLDPNEVITAAALTAAANMTQTAAVVPLTPSPTEAATGTLTPTLPATNTPANSPTPGIGTDLAEFVADVTVPDGANFPPGEDFTKVWRVKNVGTTTWTTAYGLTFFGGDQMGGPDSVPLSGSVAPGQTVDLSVDLVAPDDEGDYIGYWMLQNAGGDFFGVGPEGKFAIYVQINVVGSAPTATTGGTAAPTVTGTVEATATTPPSGDIVSDVSLDVDEADVTGACPHIFNFTAEFTLSEAATVTYQLDAETGGDITLPDPTTLNLGAGVQTANYALEFTDSVTGWARFLVTEPNEVNSSLVNFSLTCQ